MSVDVAAGRALYEITNTNLTPSETYKIYHDSDAVENVAIATADATNPRIDIIIAKCDVSQDPDSAAGNIPDITVVAGTPAGSPSAPATPANSIKLAEIAVAAGATSIVNANVADSRTYVTLDTGVLADVTRTSTLNALIADLAATTNGDGASLIGVEDSAANFTGDTVEEVLAELQDNIDAITATPTGVIVEWATKIAPASWLLCNGAAVSRATYSALFAAIAPTLGTFTVTIGSPAVFSKTGHGLVEDDAVYFTTTGALPTGLTADTIYYVIASGLTADAFQVSATIGGAAVSTSGTQSGVHTVVLCPYGLGDGSTTFNVPDKRGRVGVGDDKMSVSAASRVTAAKALGVTGGTANGTHTHTPTTEIATNSGGSTTFVKSFSSTSVLPPYLTVNYIIKT